MNADIREIGERTRRRIAFRLLPFVFAMYVVCYVDRANVAFANLRMSADLGLGAKAYGLGVGMFFVGYVLFEIPGAVIVERWSARKWMARIMITWGLITILCGFVHTPNQFYIVRFLVGLSEASFFPGIIVHLTHWFRHSDRAKAIGFFYTANPTAMVAGSLFAGWLLRIHWLGMAGWRWLFIMEGVPPIVLGAVALFYLTDWPREAGWLSEEECDWITSELDAETRAKKHVRDCTVWQAMRDPRVWVMSIVWSLALMGGLGNLYWMPVFIQRASGLSDSKIALLVMLPGILGAVATLVNGWHSDATRERRWHAALPLFFASACFLLLSIPGIQFPILFVLLSAGAGVYYGFQPVFWSIPTLMLCESAAAASFGLINSVAQVGGFAGPYAVGYLNDRTGHHSAAFAFIGTCLLLAGSVMMLLKVRSPVAESSHSSIPAPLLAERS